MVNNKTVVIYGQTDVGLSRDHNEDNISWDDDLCMAVLADGMGGHNAGEKASLIAVEQVFKAINAVLPQTEPSSALHYIDIVRNAVVIANTEIHTHSLSHPECAGMGTTLVMTIILENKLVFANVGDSRLYRLRDKKLEQISSDHSLVQELVDNGYLSVEEAKLSVSKNLITRALGISPDVDVDVQQLELQDNDLYLLCSDGLSDLVNDEVIYESLLETCDDLQQASTALINLANLNGGTDNISVILVAARGELESSTGN